MEMTQTVSKRSKKKTTEGPMSGWQDSRSDIQVYRGGWSRRAGHRSSLWRQAQGLQMRTLWKVVKEGCQVPLTYRYRNAEGQRRTTKTSPGPFSTRLAPMSADVPSGCPRHFPICFLQGLGSGLPSLQLGEQAKVLCRNLHPHSMSRTKDAVPSCLRKGRPCCWHHLLWALSPMEKHESRKRHACGKPKIALFAVVAIGVLLGRGT